MELAFQIFPNRATTKGNPGHAKARRSCRRKIQISLKPSEQSGSVFCQVGPLKMGGVLLVSLNYNPPKRGYPQKRKARPSTTACKACQNQNYQITALKNLQGLASTSFRRTTVGHGRWIHRCLAICLRFSPLKACRKKERHQTSVHGMTSPKTMCSEGTCELEEGRG